MEIAPSDQVFRLCPQAVMEGFDGGALVLRLEDRRVFELDPVAHRIVALSDGKRTSGQVAAALAEALGVAEAEMLPDVLSRYEHLVGERILERADLEEKELMTESSAVSALLIRNPDVVLREEDQDGGLLFNPDTNQVKVLNPTALFIWQQCDGTRNAAGIAAAILAAFEDAPAEQVDQDVREFVEGMVATGFIGTVEECTL